MFDEADLLPISGLSQFVYCERRAALATIERMWHENSYTIEGSELHKIVDEEGRRIEKRKDLRIERAVVLRSLVLGIGGVSDVVEYNKVQCNQDGIKKTTKKTKWIPYPVEYKRGKPKPDESDTVQLCAQALCLEELNKIEIPRGALYYHQKKRRLEVMFDNRLREFTKDTIKKFHALIQLGKTPKAQFGPKCKDCSLLPLCMPKATDGKRSVSEYIKNIIKGE